MIRPAGGHEYASSGVCRAVVGAAPPAVQAVNFVRFYPGFNLRNQRDFQNLIVRVKETIYERPQHSISTAFIDPAHSQAHFGECSKIDEFDQQEGTLTSLRV